MIRILALGLRKVLKPFVLLTHEALELHDLAGHAEGTLRGVLLWTIAANLLTEVVQTLFGVVGVAFPFVAAVATDSAGSDISKHMAGVKKRNVLLVRKANVLEACGRRTVSNLDLHMIGILVTDLSAVMSGFL